MESETRRFSDFEASMSVWYSFTRRRPQLTPTITLPLITP